jgi:DNA end-binding protein Ku
VQGICTWTMRKKTYFGALQASGPFLRLNTLRYADEVVPVASLGLQDVPLSDRELSIGSELIDKMTASFDPRKYVNEHEEKLREMIEKKARGEHIAILAPRRLKPTESDDLLHVLEESLKKAA